MLPENISTAAGNIPSAPKQALFGRRSLLVFLFGLLLGIAAFSSYHYYRLSRELDGNNDQNILDETPASFNITNTDHIWGNKDAAVTMVVFSDLTCPYCREYFAIVDEFMKTRADKVRLVWRHMPLSLDSAASISSAVAAECAGAQGKFFEYASALYKNQEKLSAEFFVQAAEALGLDKNAFSACIVSGQYDEKIKADYTEGIAKGVIGTPASFLNGRYLPGALPLGQLEALIDPLIK